MKFNASILVIIYSGKKNMKFNAIILVIIYSGKKYEV